GGFDLGDLAHQSRGFGCQTGLSEVTRQAFLEVLGFADVEQPVVRVIHPVYAGAATGGREKGSGIEYVGHFQLTASTMPWRTASSASSTSLVMAIFSKIR